MAIFFGRVSKDELGTRYTHYGRFYCIVPVYLGDPYGEVPDVAVRNGWPNWLLDVCDAVFDFAAWCWMSVDPTWEHPGFFYTVDGEINRGD